MKNNHSKMSMFVTIVMNHRTGCITFRMPLTDKNIKIMIDNQQLRFKHRHNNMFNNYIM